MALYYGYYRVNSASPSDNQYEKMNAATQSKFKDMIEMRYPGAKITWVHNPVNASKPPSWFKG